ncbi:unnamed protein product [Caenorhabditis nigoni]
MLLYGTPIGILILYFSGCLLSIPLPGTPIGILYIDFPELSEFMFKMEKQKLLKDLMEVILVRCFIVNHDFNQTRKKGTIRKKIPTRIRLLETIARRWEIIDPITIDSTFGADRQITVALEPLADHIRRQVAYEFDLSTKLQKLEAILIVLKFEVIGEKSNKTSASTEGTPSGGNLKRSRPASSSDEHPTIQIQNWKMKYRSRDRRENLSESDTEPVKRTSLVVISTSLMPGKRSQEEIEGQCTKSQGTSRRANRHIPFNISKDEKKDVWLLERKS